MSKSETSSPKPGGHSKLYATIGIVGIVAAFFFAADIASHISAKVDLTENKVYTVSDGTKELLSDLPVEVKLRFYVNSEKDGLPPHVREYARRFWDLLREYERFGGGKLKVERLDPSPDTDEEDSAIADGVSPSFDRFTQNQYYFSVALTSLGQIVTLPPVDQIPEPMLEYLLTKAINEVSTLQESKPKITVVSGVPLEGFAMQGRPGFFIFSELSKRFAVDYVEPTGSALVKPDDEGNKVDPSAVVIVHPHNITPEMEFEIDQYVLRGGNVLAFVDPAYYFAPRAQQPMFQGAPPTPPTPQKSDLPNLFKAWGIDFSTDRFVADMIYKTQIGLPDETPVVLTLADDAISADDPVISQIPNTLVLLAGSLGGKDSEKIEREILLQSSSSSKLVTDSTDPNMLPPNVPPSPSLRILNPEANRELVTGFQVGAQKIIPITNTLNAPDIVAAVYSPDIPRKLKVMTTDASGDDLAGTVLIVGAGANGKMITEKVTVKAGSELQLTKNTFATVTSVSHDFGKTGEAGKDTLEIIGAGEGRQHPIAIRLIGEFATAFPDGRPASTPAPGPGAGPNPHSGLPGFNIPGLGAPGAEGDEGEGGESSASDVKAEPGSAKGDPAPAAGAPATPDAPATPSDNETEADPKPAEPSTAAEPKPVEPAPTETEGGETKEEAPSEGGETPTETDDPAGKPATVEPGKTVDEKEPDTGTETKEPVTPNGDKGEAGKGENTDPPAVPVPPVGSGEETPEGAKTEEPKEPSLKESQKKGVVVVVADVDLLSNQFTSSVERRLVPPGQIVDVTVPNNQLGNFSFSMNLIEQLTADTRLLAIRSRSASSRPLTHIKKIESEANKEILAKEAEAQQDIQKLVARLQVLEQAKGKDESTNELVVQKQEEEIRAENGKLVKKRKELREMQKAKKAKKESLIARIKAWNIVAVPVFVILIGLAIATIRRFTTAAR